MNTIESIEAQIRRGERELAKLPGALAETLGAMMTLAPDAYPITRKHLRVWLPDEQNEIKAAAFQLASTHWLSPLLSGEIMDSTWLHSDDPVREVQKAINNACNHFKGQIQEDRERLVYGAEGTIADRHGQGCEHDPVVTAERDQVAEAVRTALDGLSDIERLAVEMLADGKSARAIQRETGLDRRSVPNIVEVFRGIDREPSLERLPVIRARAGNSDKVDMTPAPIDLEMERVRQMDRDSGRRERHYKRCPPCWECRYFLGWAPPNHIVPAQHADPEMQAALRAVDARKAQIATASKDE